MCDVTFASIRSLDGSERTDVAMDQILFNWGLWALETPGGKRCEQVVLSRAT